MTYLEVPASSYCTLAVTVALLPGVNVQAFVLLPPLEHAPDQMAPRPLATLSVIEVPAAKGADPVVPTDTLMPAGLEVIRSPLRPVAATVTVSVSPPAGACGVKLRVEENGPNRPAALRARTRHHSCCAGKPLRAA